MFYTFRDEAENITVEEGRACDFSLGYIGISEFDEVGRLFDLPKNRVETTEIVFACVLTKSKYLFATVLLLLCATIQRKNSRFFRMFFQNLTAQMQAEEK